MFATKKRTLVVTERAAVWETLAAIVADVEPSVKEPEMADQRPGCVETVTSMTSLQTLIHNGDCI